MFPSVAATAGVVVAAATAAVAVAAAVNNAEVEWPFAVRVSDCS